MSDKSEQTELLEAVRDLTEKVADIAERLKAWDRSYGVLLSRRGCAIVKEPGSDNGRGVRQR